MNKKRWTPWAMILGAFALPLAGLEVPAFTGAVELRVDARIMGIVASIRGAEATITGLRPPHGGGW